MVQFKDDRFKWEKNASYWMKTSWGCLLAFTLSYYFLEMISCNCVITLGLLLLANKLSSFLMTVVRKFAPKKRILNPEKKAVFVTGCDTGFGHNAAKLLDEAGFWVYAACLTPSSEIGPKKLKDQCSSRLMLVHLDVSNADMISSAVQFVKDTLDGKELWAVVNNAGIGNFSMLDWVSIDTYRKIHEVNAFGPVQVTNAFLPLLKRSKGRIVNVVSVLGTFSWPGTVPYCMSKHAALAFTDGLRQELKPFGVTAHAILPVLYRTPITDYDTRSRDVDKSWAQASQETKESYGKNYAEELKIALKKTNDQGSENVMEVSEDILDAISDVQPQDKYIPGFIPELLIQVYNSLPLKLRNYIACYHFPRIISPEDAKKR